MKQREPRKRIISRARMLSNAGWSDVQIRDVSSRGIGLCSPHAPRKGDVIELRHRHHKIVGRVVWSKGEQFGVLLHEPIAVDDLIQTIAQSAKEGERRGDRRSERRYGDAPKGQGETRFAIVSTAERSRHAARMMNAVAIGIIACTAAATVATMAGSVFSGAMERVSVALVPAAPQGAPPPQAE